MNVQRNKQFLNGVLFLLILLSSCACDQGSENQLIASAHRNSHLLIETEGEISRILLYAGSGLENYFVRNSGLFGPCVLDTKLVSGSFISSYESKLERNEDLRFAFNTSFGEKELKLILEKYPNISIEDWSNWVQINQPLAQNYSSPRINGVEGDLFSELELDRIAQVFSIEQAHSDYVARASEGKVIWTSADSAGFLPAVVIAPKERYGLSKSVNKIDSNVKIEDRIIMLSAQFRYLKAMVEQERSNHGLKTLNPSNRIVLRACTICYCDYVNTPQCDSPCISNIEGSLGQYLQDRIHVRILPEGTRYLNTSRAYNPNGVCYNTDNWAMFFKGITCSDSSKTDQLCSIAGGNMFVTKDILFVGRDELMELTKSSNRLQSEDAAARRQSIGIPTNDVNTIEKTLLQSVYGKTQGKHLIWVGLDKVGKLFGDAKYDRASYQSLFHIDLYFSPLGVLNSTNKFYYIFSEPVVIPSSYTGTFNVSELERDLALIRANLDTSLKALGYDPVGIVVPLAVRPFPSEVRRTGRMHAFANGIMEKRDGKVNYLMPSYAIGRPPHEVQIGYDSCFNAAKVSLASGLKAAVGDKFEVIPVLSSSYTSDSALRCQVKVIERK